MSKNFKVDLEQMREAIKEFEKIGDRLRDMSTSLDFDPWYFDKEALWRTQ